MLQEIRSTAFPVKRIALQQSLAAADESGDGYITKVQFVDAFYRASVNMSRENLEFLFDVMSESFNEASDTMVVEDKFLNLLFFIEKLFTRNEYKEFSEVDMTLQLLKASLIYKGVDFGVIFAEQSEEVDPNKRGRGKKGRRTSTRSKTPTKKADQPVDMMCHYSRFAQQMIKEEFCQRLEKLNAQNVTKDMIRRLANYLALNQKNKSVIYLNSWIHHLRRVGTAFQVPNKSILPIICSKLLQKQTYFRSVCDEYGILKNKHEQEKFIDISNLRKVLTKFGLSYINQGMFIQEFTKGVQVHIDDLIAQMNQCKKKQYGSEEGGQVVPHDSSEPGGDAHDTEMIQKQDFFSKIAKAIRNRGDSINVKDLKKKCKQFDQAGTGSIKVYHLINVLNHNLPGTFSGNDLVGLQFELETLSYDQTVDYKEFFHIYFGEDQSAKQRRAEKEDFKIEWQKKSAYSLMDYEEILARISSTVNELNLDLDHIFGIFTKQGGFIEYHHLRKIFELIGFEFSDKDFEIITLYADETGVGTILAYDLMQQIVNAEKVAPQFEMHKWIIASRELDNRVNLLETVMEHLDHIIDDIDLTYSTDFKVEGGAVQQEPPRVLTAEQF